MYTQIATFCPRPLSGDVCICLAYIRKWSTLDVCTHHPIKTQAKMYLTAVCVCVTFDFKLNLYKIYCHR